MMNDGAWLENAQIEFSSSGRLEPICRVLDAGSVFFTQFSSNSKQILAEIVSCRKILAKLD